MVCWNVSDLDRVVVEVVVGVVEVVGEGTAVEEVEVLVAVATDVAVVILISKCDDFGMSFVACVYVIGTRNTKARTAS